MSSYQTLVSAMPSLFPEDQSLPHPRVIMSFRVQLCYVLQSEVRGETGFPPRILDYRAFSYQAEHPTAPFASSDHSPSSPSWAIVSSMLDDMRLPFLLDRVVWLNLSAGMKATKKHVTCDELVSEIGRFASGIVNDPSNEGRKRTKIAVSLIHKVTISEGEFREMRAELRRLELRYLHSRMLGEEGRGRRFPILERRLLLNLMRQEGLATSPDRTRESTDRAAINFESDQVSRCRDLYGTSENRRPAGPNRVLP